MSILRLDGVRREIGDFVILNSVSASLARGERVGLVGANGAGKTTLLEIVAGREEPDGGKVALARGTRIGLLSQEAHLDPRLVEAPSVRVAVRGGAAEVEHMEQQLAAMEAQGAAAVESPDYASLRERFEARDGYHLDLHVEEALDGLGIRRNRWASSPMELSGGEQTRVALARLLVADPDLLMLDEPTNHLDIAALEWLEAVLVRRHGALLVASHDRAFLDNVVDAHLGAARPPTRRLPGRPMRRTSCSASPPTRGRAAWSVSRPPPSHVKRNSCSAIAASAST